VLLRRGRRWRLSLDRGGHRAPAAWAHHHHHQHSPVRLQCWVCKLAVWVVHQQEGLVLRACGQGLHHNAQAASAHDASAPTSPTATSSSIRLQCGLRELAGWVVGAQESVVLPPRWQGLPNAAASHAAAPSVRLQCGLCQLAGWVVRAKEGVVLPARGQRLSHAAAHATAHALRLQCGLRKLAGWMV